MIMPFLKTPFPLRISLLSSFLQNGRKVAISSLMKGTRCVSSVVEVPEFECDILHDDVKATEKDNALRLALSRLSGEFGRESMMSLQRFFRLRHAPVVSTGSLKLDLALGIGGLPKGRIVEIYGPEASGKTTLGLQIIKEAQELGGYCAYLDVENAMDTSFAESMGINTQNLLISRPDSAENLLSVVDTLTKTGSVDVIVVDSVAALVPQCELDVQIGGINKDMQSRLMAQALRKIHYSLCRSETLIVFINQVRTNIRSDQAFGRKEEVTCGGNALEFYAAVRMKIVRTGLLKVEDKITGLGICVQVVKNKLAPAMKKAEMEILFGRGICREADVLDLACEHGVILKQGGSYVIRREIFSSKEEARKYLSENERILDKIVMILRRLLFVKGA